MNRLMRLKNRKANRKGFTLVELIVVLVILAILAAILIPALLGWIDRAREKQDLLNAKNCLTAIQAGLTEEYAKNSSDLKQGGISLEYLIIPPKTGVTQANNNGDVNATSAWSGNGNNRTYNPNVFADKVLETIDKKDTKTQENKNDDPMVIIFGVGSNVDKNSTVTLHEKYTVYYLMYQQTADSTPLFYYDGRWTSTNPTTDKSMFTNRYTPKTGPLAGKKIQYYIISNKLTEYVGNGKTIRAGDSEFWKYVESFK